MGRRKIEIQPITHERNRSVTFTKRKNGLFKKAYELGVLCSVDVAVIIFEERAGHQVRQYQYCSSDIHDVVQRHMRFDGEKDARGPSDFSGSTLSKLDEGDDDDADDDDEVPVRATSTSTKRRGDGRAKAVTSQSGSNIPMSVDTDYHRTLTIPPPPMPMHLTSPNISNSSLPISSDRHSAIHDGSSTPRHHHQYQHQPHAFSNPNPNKKPRISASNPLTNITSSATGGGSAYTYDPTSQPQPAFRSPYTLHPQSAQYSDFPDPTSNPYALPPSFAGTQATAFDFPPTSSSRDTPPPQRGTATFPPRSAGAAYDQRMYQQVMRHPQRGPDIFPPFLDADEQSRLGQGQGQGPGQGQNASSVRLDWPVHVQGQQQQPHQPGQNIPTDPPNSEHNWLDFLSGNGNKTSSSAGARIDPQLSGPGREAIAMPDRIGGGGSRDGSAPRRSSSGRTSAVTSPHPMTGGDGDAKMAGVGGGGGGGESNLVGKVGVDEGPGKHGDGRPPDGRVNGGGNGSHGEAKDGVPE